MDSRPATCTSLDSLFQHSGFEVPITLHAKVTVDADQYRIRGKSRIETKPTGDISFDFSSSVFFGAHREDFFFSIVADTLRILDRERGQYYESADAARYMEDILGMDFDAKTVMLIALGRTPSCDEIESLRREARANGEVRFVGEVTGQPFEVVFGAEHRRLKEISWPLRREKRRDQVRVTYQWTKGNDAGFTLRQVVIRLLEREWRCKITAVTK